MAIDYLEFVRSDTSALVDTARRCPPDTPVPSCPGWTVARLCRHVGTVHRWATAAVVTGAEPDPSTLERPGPGDEVAYLEAGAVRLIDALRAADPGAPGWHWAAGPQVRGFWWRRMAHETAVHRWDAQSACGAPEPIAADLASDGIDELLGTLVPTRLSAYDGGSLHLHCTDVHGEWTIRSEAGAYVLERGHAKGDCALRGPASTLLLALWRRVPVSDPALELFGDVGVLDAWLARGLPG